MLNHIYQLVCFECVNGEEGFFRGGVAIFLALFKERSEIKQQYKIQTRTKTEYNAKMPNLTTKEINHIKLFFLLRTYL